MYDAPFFFLHIEKNYEKIRNFIYSLSSSPWPKEVHLYTDGASRGNPGPASIGIHVTNKRKEKVEGIALYLGQSTNNYAEYFGIFTALELALKKEVSSVHLFTDSQLLERQIKGEYKVKASGLKAIYKICHGLIQNLDTFHIKHLRREFNEEADALANQALDELELK